MHHTSLELDMTRAGRWYKGQLHAHANWGISSLGVPTTAPDTVVRWYREHDFNFVAVTDLNYATPVAGLQAVFDAPGRFIVLPGIELSESFPVLGDVIIDTLGIGVTEVPKIPKDVVPGRLLEAQAETIHAVGGLAIAAHPNLNWSWSARDLLECDPGKGPGHFEVWTSEPGMNPAGGGGYPSTDEIWDEILTAGYRLYGVATDDSHHFYPQHQSLEYATPGRAWVCVYAAELTLVAIDRALRAGHFYASTGVDVASYRVDANGIAIDFETETRDIGWSNPGRNPQRHTTDFIGEGGALLKRDTSQRAEYEFVGNETYVRARITNSDGQRGWTQPVFPRDIQPWDSAAPTS